MKQDLEKEFEQIYEKFSKLIFRFVYLKTSQYELAEDLTSETFLKFWKRLAADQTVENDKALLYTIANGLIIDFYRKGERKKKTSLENIDERVFIGEENLEEEIFKKEQIKIIFSALQKIKKEYQEVLILHYVEDFGISEIAELIKKKETAVRVLLHRAIKSLKGKL